MADKKQKLDAECPPPYADDSIMPLGKYKGEMMCDIPDSYLRIVHDIMKPDFLLKAYICDRLCIPSTLNGTNHMTHEELRNSKL